MPKPWRESGEKEGGRKMSDTTLEEGWQPQKENATKLCVLESMMLVRRRIKTKIMETQKQENKCVKRW